MRQLGYLSNENSLERKKRMVTLGSQALVPLDTDHKDLNPQDLLKRIKELEKQLETSQLKAEGYEIMIEIAEKELNIPIRKKSDTK
jgi:transposase